MPTGLFPRSGPRPTSSRGEILVYEALQKHLPEGWTAWHSLRVRTPQGFEGESDFVISVPGRGVILMEVKGGQVELRDGHWTQNGRPLRKAPLDQARGYLSKLLSTMRSRDSNVKANLATALCVPQTFFSAEPSSSYLEDRVVGAQDLPRFGEALLELADELFAENYYPTRGDVAVTLHELFGETWIPRLCLGDQVAHRKQTLVPLDEEQFLFLEMARENENVLFRGGPGTGKTLLAAEKGRRLQSKGQRPLYLCWTTPLARKLRQLHDFPIKTVRELAASALEQQGIQLQEGALRDDWTPETWALAPRTAALQAAAQIRESFDALIIDEAQDYSAEDWEFVLALAEGRPLWAFADEGQGFWAEREIPEAAFSTKLRLPRRYRCPEELARFADLYRAGAEAKSSELPENLQGRLTLVKTESPCAESEILPRLLTTVLQDGALPEQIAILSLAGKEQSSLCKLKHLGPHELRAGDADDAHEHIICDTFLRFKGLERPIIFVTELEKAKTKYDLRMHIALTRTQVQCIVVASESQIASDPRLRDLAAL